MQLNRIPTIYFVLGHINVLLLYYTAAHGQIFMKNYNFEF